ncbi:MAG: c-type cytochrome [Planctomycetes bacterium]|nr:c-type cytochrome [Planctomycetota bacterium]
MFSRISLFFLGGLVTTVALGSIVIAQTAIDKREALRAYALTHDGNAGSGSCVFVDCGSMVAGQTAGCVTCHSRKANDDGGKLGPSLFGVGSRLTREQIIDQVLSPHKNKNPMGVAVEFKTGRLQSFRLLAESRELLSVRDLDTGERNVLHVAELERYRRTPLMPEGLADKMTPRQFADLVAYLVSLKK